MKRTLKYVLLLVALLGVVFLLTGCGNKLIATKKSDEAGQPVKETIEIKFKKDEIQEVKMIGEFDSKEEAEEQYEGIMAFADYMSGVEVEQKGKKVIITYSADGAEMMFGKNASKKDVKEMLEDEGYKVK